MTRWSGECSQSEIFTKIDNTIGHGFSFYSLSLSLSLSLSSSIDTSAPVIAVHSSPGTPHILTHSHSVVRGWRVQQLYKCSAIIGRDIASLTTTTHPLVPTRLLATCGDSAVRLVCPVGGHVITTALLPPGKHITSLVYFSLTGMDPHNVGEDKGGF